MTRRFAAIAAMAVGLGLALGGCSGGKETQREDETATQAVTQPTEPKIGLLTDVDSRRLLLDAADDPGDEPALFERTTRSVVMRDGAEVSWDVLSEGDAVRVTWDRGVFGPARIAHVEVLSGADADRVRQQVEGDSGFEEDLDTMEPRPIDPGPVVPGDPTPPGQEPGTEPGPGF